MSLKNKKDLYFLVTTALYETWNEKEQTIFLGEWCLIFNKFDKNKHPNYMVHPYHWDDRSKYNSDFDLIDSLYEKKLLELMKLLNQFHGVNNNIKYWRVIIGPWLRSFIEILFDRYEVLKSVKYKVSNSLILDYNLNDFIPLNNIKFSKQIKTDDWNHVIFAEIIKSLNIPYSNLGIKIINQKRPSQPLINNLIFLIKNFLLKIYSSVFTKHLNKVLIKDAYMPIWNEVKLNLLFSQLPVRTPISSVEKPKIITDFRNSRKILQSNSDFEKLLNRLLINLMPFSYLENLEKIKKETNLYYPKNPKIIFTSNAYHHNDNFKIMTAERRVKNTPYVIGQHGGGFRNTLKDQTVLHQLKSCDKFFSWGWTDKLFFKNKVQRLPSLKLSRKIENPKSNGHILITTPSYPRYFYCHFTTPVAGQLLQILNNILYFIENLDSKEIIKIKLDSEEVLSPQGNLKSSISRPISLGWNIRDRFLSKGLSHALSEGENFNQLLKESRLSVATYNSTIYYETLAANFPTVIFFDSSLYEINEEAKINNVKVIYAGSSSKHHDPSDSPYAMTKFLGEEICKLYKKSFNVNVEIARFYNVYGPIEPIDEKFGNVIGIWRAKVKKSLPLPIVGDGNQKRDFTHVFDIVDGLLKISNSEIRHNDAWEIGTGVNYSINELYEMFKERYKTSSVSIPDQRGNYRETLRVNDDLINLLNWKPKDRLKEYIENLKSS